MSFYEPNTFGIKYHEGMEGLNNLLTLQSTGTFSKNKDERDQIDKEIENRNSKISHNEEKNKNIGKKEKSSNLLRIRENYEILPPINTYNNYKERNKVNNLKMKQLSNRANINNINLNKNKKNITQKNIINKYNFIDYLQSKRPKKPRIKAYKSIDEKYNYELLNYQTKKFEDRVKYQEQLMRVKGNYNYEEKDNIKLSNLLMGSISTKLSILDKYSSQNI